MDDQATSADAQQKERSKSAPDGGAVEGPFDPSKLIGRVLDGRYELVKCIGRGGMGVVYLARQSALGRDVVVKVLPPSFADDADALARFEREARGMSKLQHPHVVSIYDFGSQDGQTYIVMEYVEGTTLRQFVRSRKALDFPTFGRIALQLLEGIDAAHSLGLVHRDIKPSNIMLTTRRGERNYVKILDFGLAKLVKGAQDVTREQSLVGSVGFLSPEQILGQKTDERVDVYALGVLFYYMLVGEKPFVGEDDVAVLYQHVHSEPAPLDERLGELWPAGHDVPQSVIDLIHRALAKSPGDRPGNAGQFLREFGACLDGTDISSPHVSGEFNAVSKVAALSSLSPDDPSSRLDRQRQETPFHQVPSHATPTNSGLVMMEADPSASGQATWISGEHLLKMERQNRTRNILLGVLGVLILGGMAMLFVNRDSKTIAIGEEAAPSGLAKESKTATTVAPPAQPEAPIARGTLELRTEPEAAVILDGIVLGQTPISQQISVGAHSLEIRQDGWETIRREIEIRENTTVRLNLELKETMPTRRADSREAPPETRTDKRNKPDAPQRPASKPDAPTKAAKKTPKKEASAPKAPAAAPKTAPEPAVPLLLPAEDDSASDLLPTSPSGGGDDLLLD
jgi:serine/threonine protein kinase